MYKFMDNEEECFLMLFKKYKWLKGHRLKFQNMIKTIDYINQ